MTPEQPRWHDQTCTRCGTHLGPGTPTFQLSAARYEPMQDTPERKAPEWEAVGDWTDPESIAGTLCGPCLKWISDEVMHHRFTGGQPASGHGEPTDTKNGEHQ